MTDKKESLVLLVEDTMTQALLYQHAFQQQGINTKVAKSAAQALEIIRDSKPTLVVSDVNMPVQNGYQLSKEIKSNSTTSDIYVVLLSTVLDPSEIYDIVNSECDDFILKNMPPEFIAEQIKRLLDAIRQDQDREGSGQKQAFQNSVPLRAENRSEAMKLRPGQAANLIYSLYQSICKLEKKA